MHTDGCKNSFGSEHRQNRWVNEDHGTYTYICMYYYYCIPRLFSRHTALTHAQRDQRDRADTRPVLAAQHAQHTRQTFSVTVRGPETAYAPLGSAITPSHPY